MFDHWRWIVQPLLGTLAILGVSWVAPAPTLAMQHSAECAPGEVPVFRDAFAQLKADLGPIMGEPTSCWYFKPGDDAVFQDTTTGLAYHRPAFALTIFTDGWRHWARTTHGPMFWQGVSSQIPDEVCGWEPGTGRPTVGEWFGPRGAAFWTVIVGSFQTRTEAEDLGVRLCTGSLSAGVLFSSDYRSLNPGYWVTHSGFFLNRGEAAQEAVRLQGIGLAGAYPRELRR